LLDTQTHTSNRVGANQINKFCQHETIIIKDPNTHTHPPTNRVIQRIFGENSWSQGGIYRAKARKLLKGSEKRRGGVGRDFPEYNIFPLHLYCCHKKRL